MDEERPSLGPRLGKWRYTNTAVYGAPVVTCKNGDCALEQIEPLARVVADTTAPQANRIQSLLMLIHMIEDMHQPLHGADNHDRGGNDIEVIYAGARKPLERKLHEFWDTELVKMDLRGNAKRRYIEEAASRAMSLTTSSCSTTRNVGIVTPRICLRSSSNSDISISRKLSRVAGAIHEPMIGRMNSVVGWSPI